MSSGSTPPAGPHFPILCGTRYVVRPIDSVPRTPSYCRPPHLAKALPLEVQSEISSRDGCATEEQGGDAVEEFVDSHFHFWDLTKPEVEYAWLGPGTRHPVLG